LVKTSIDQVVLHVSGKHIIMNTKQIDLERCEICYATIADGKRHLTTTIHMQVINGEKTKEQAIKFWKIHY